MHHLPQGNLDRFGENAQELSGKLHKGLDGTAKRLIPLIKKAINVLDKVAALDPVTLIMNKLEMAKGI